MHTVAVAVAVAALALAAATTLYAARCWPRWSHGDRINYAVMSAAVYPWVIAGGFVTVPTAYTRTVLVVGGSALAVFLIRQALWLRRSGRELRRIQHEVATVFAERPIRVSGPSPCPDNLLGRRHGEHDWTPPSGHTMRCLGYPWLPEDPPAPAP